MFVVVIFYLFYVLVKICGGTNREVIPVKYGRELTLTRYMQLHDRYSTIASKQYESEMKITPTVRLELTSFSLWNLLFQNSYLID